MKETFTSALAAAAPRIPTLQRVAQMHKLAGHLVSPLGVVPYPADPVLITRPSTERWDWAVMDIAVDPAYVGGILGVPRTARRRLRAIEDTGVTFDHILIAHEVPKDRVLASGASELKKNDIAAKVHATASAPVQKWAALLDSLLSSGAELARSVLKTAPGSDPLVMGAIDLDVPGPPLAAVFHLVHWQY